MKYKKAIYQAIRHLFHKSIKIQFFILRAFPYRNKLKSMYCDAFASVQTSLISHVSYMNRTFYFLASSSNSEYRARTALTKEPETIKWIETFKETDVLYDIGANIGLYSVLAAATKNTKVFAFEPSFYNLPHLAENIKLNCVTDKICIIPVPLFETTTEDQFTLSEALAGSAIANFSTGLDQSGNPMFTHLSYRTLGFGLDDLIETAKIPRPTKIKLDVDGIEHLILSGAADLLSSSSVNSVLVEVSDSYDTQREIIEKLMKRNGFSLNETETRSRESSSHNQIWVK